jgi:hypothetical protein
MICSMVSSIDEPADARLMLGSEMVLDPACVSGQELEQC